MCSLVMLMAAECFCGGERRKEGSGSPNERGRNVDTSFHSNRWSILRVKVGGLC